MNRKLYWPLLAVEAAALAVLCFTGAIDGSPLPLVTAVPWAQIAALLRTLSLGGGVGNAVAIVLYVLICLLPLLALGLIRRRRRWAAEDAMLAALSALLFWGLYTLINPGRLAAVYGATLERVAIGLASVSAYKYPMCSTLCRVRSGRLQQVLRGSQDTDRRTMFRTAMLRVRMRILQLR